MPIKRVLQVLILAVMMIVGCAPESSGDGIVRLVFFWSENCSHCHEMMEEFIPGLEEEFGEQLVIAFIETSDEDAYDIYLAAVEQFNVPKRRRGVPAVYIGNQHMVGSVEIPEKLPALVEQQLKRGGIDYPGIPGLTEFMSNQPSGEY